MRFLYSVYDKVAEMFGPTFEAVNDQVAQRNFRALLKESFDKEDYQLFKVLDFNEDLTVAKSELKCIVEGVSMKEGVDEKL